ncbi:MAG: InlB B-repeat-containing protein [Bacteroidales bacterium]|jgi:uncharacterized protein (TIGR02145 family)/uncharacterized repeat protein (TIGR02543 family)|nr:InlB B-repeat-containing protein [Bacteroidales bacterium]
MKKINLFITLLAIYVLFLAGCKKNNLTVTYDANGGIGTMPAQNFERDEPQVLLPNAFVCEGYWFRGWNTAADGSAQKYTNQQIIAIKEDMTLYAQWRADQITYYVLFFANGGSGTMENQAFTENKWQKLSPNTFTRHGNKFTGWNTKADGTGYLLTDEQSIVLTENIALYAQWADLSVTGKPCTGTPTVKDADGNTYKTVKIGSQCWMKENLKTTKYNTGEVIPLIINNMDWSEAVSGAYCYYDNNIANADTYGALYNGYAVNTELLCPAGWHVPTENEWGILLEEMGGLDISGYKLKNETGWEEAGYGGGNGNNESGFSALPAGMRLGYFGTFQNKGEATSFWSSTDNMWGKIYIFLYYGKEFSGRENSDEYGYSVRCVKD